MSILEQIQAAAAGTVAVERLPFDAYALYYKYGPNEWSHWGDAKSDEHLAKPGLRTAICLIPPTALAQYEVTE